MGVFLLVFAFLIVSNNMSVISFWLLETFPSFTVIGKFKKKERKHETKILIILFLIFPINTFALVLGEDGLYEEPWIIETLGS